MKKACRQNSRWAYSQGRKFSDESEFWLLNSLNLEEKRGKDVILRLFPGISDLFYKLSYRLHPCIVNKCIHFKLSWMIGFRTGQASSAGCAMRSVGAAVRAPPLLTAGSATTLRFWYIQILTALRYYSYPISINNFTLVISFFSS